NNENMTFTKVSAAENEISDFIRGWGFEVSTGNRKILEGKEIDIYVPELKIGFEYDGLLYHCEEFGKNRMYHLSKTKKAYEKSVTLYHIFEDEYLWKKDLLFANIRQLLGKEEGKMINCNECEIKEVNFGDAKKFLNEFHLEGCPHNGSLFLGAFYDNVLVAVMTFYEDKHLNWKVSRFATNHNYISNDIERCLFNHFTNNYGYKQVDGFADRRWTPFDGSTIFNSIGFDFVKYEEPNYWIFVNKLHEMKRHHRMEFRKKTLMEMYGYPESMTTDEMLINSKMKKIWDCGLIRYVYRNPDVVQSADKTEDNEKSIENEK
ncbi:MAG: hypothetical protein J6X18_10405, partial [Bacteroidales bacterium]|nr:hypothetical protein [Bacteroidales bacterium]